MKPKPAKPAATVIPMFEMPKFDMPSFDMPKMEVPAAFREFAEKGVAQSKEAYEKFKATAEDNTAMLETVYTTATKGANDTASRRSRSPAPTPMRCSTSSRRCSP